MLKKSIIIIFIVLGILAYFNFLNSDIGSITTYLDNVNKGCSSWSSFLDYVKAYSNDITANFGSSFSATLKSILSIMFAPIAFVLCFFVVICDIVLSIFGVSARGFEVQYLYNLFSLDGFIRSIGSSIHFIGRFNLF